MNRPRMGLLLALAAALLAGPGLARAHGPRVHFGFAFGPGFYPAPYYAPYYYPPPFYYPPTVVVPPAPQRYIERDEETDAQNYWYYCAASKAYYPYVKQCPGGWQRVNPQPPPG